MISCMESHAYAWMFNKLQLLEAKLTNACGPKINTNSCELQTIAIPRHWKPVDFLEMLCATLCFTFKVKVVRLAY